MSTVYSLPQIAYWVAYQVLPHYTFKALDKAVQMWTTTPTSAGPFFYLMACQMAELEPVPDDARMFSASTGVLGSYDYYLMEYPVPPPVDPAGTDPVTLAQQGASIVLAPHFSIILRHQSTGEIRYFILGQAPLGGGTTLRTITASGVNANMGPGPAPDRSLFLDRVTQAVAV